MPDVERTAKSVGYIDQATPETDMIFVGLGILLGGLVGLLAVSIFGISITLTTSGGALIMGLVFGWLRSKTPKFGRIPEPHSGFLIMLVFQLSLVLLVFLQDQVLFQDLEQTGLGLLFAGLIVAVIASHCWSSMWVIIY